MVQEAGELQGTDKGRRYGAVADDQAPKGKFRVAVEIMDGTHCWARRWTPAQNKAMKKVLSFFQKTVDICWKDGIIHSCTPSKN